MTKQPANKLWTYDFTVITIGSLVSMVGNAMASFGISLVVLDYTGSTFLYMLFNVCYQLPMLVMPLLAGPYLDRMSRKRAIYSLDYLSAGLYLIFFLLLRMERMNYGILLAGSVLTGAINGVYIVAYDSFYPSLIPEGYFRQAYSVSSMLWPLASMTTPLAAAVYDLLGSAEPIFVTNALCFFTAACFERSIRHQETHMAGAPPAEGLSAVKQFRRDFQEGLAYLMGERGLLMISLYFIASGVTSGATNLHLPFFRSHAHLYTAWPVAAVTLYAIVSNFDVAGRLAGGVIQYKLRIPADKKYDIAFCVYIPISIIGAALLFLPIPLMAAAFFIDGILGVTSYTIRTAATQAYVPDAKRARFNGIFETVASIGMISGSLVSGALAEALPERGVLVAANLLSLAAAYLFIYRGREAAKQVYNREV